jgi:hypothetical protein
VVVEKWPVMMSHGPSPVSTSHASLREISKRLICKDFEKSQPVACATGTVSSGYTVTK